MKIGNPFQTKQGNRPSCRDQEEWKGSVEVMPGTSCSPRVGPVCRETFGVASRVPSTVLHFNTDLGLHLTRCRGQGCIFEVIDISPGSLDSSLCFFQSSVSLDVLCIEVKEAVWQYTALTYSFSYLEPVCCSMSSSNCCFLTCIRCLRIQSSGLVFPSL